LIDAEEFELELFDEDKLREEPLVAELFPEMALRMLDRSTLMTPVVARV
jgi:hypothetical protein